ncbi:MAG: PAS domain-containing protein [Anaerolineales bacterium]|nr:PAS domain-containing protein [Anaerolineales bacterium]
MSQQEIEVILARHLAEYLAMPILITEPNGDLLFFNEPAEIILGVRYDETGPMPAEKWSAMFRSLDEDGNPLPDEERPIMTALTCRCPIHKKLWIYRQDGAMRQLAVTAFPLIAQAGRFLGVLAVFWEVVS